MRSTTRLTLAFVMVFALFPQAFGASASEMLEKGIYTEQTLGDLDAAIRIYEKILADDAANPPHIARAAK